MRRRLRYTDAAGKIKEWVDAMSTIISLLKQVEIKRCSNNWMPWSKRNEGVKIDFRTRDLDISERANNNKKNTSVVNKCMAVSKEKIKRATNKKPRNTPISLQVKSPRVLVEVDVLEMLEPNPTTLVEVHKLQEKTGRDSLRWDGD